MSVSNLHSAMVNGREIKYYLSGRGTCMVFLHGYLEDHRIWLPVAERIKKDHIVLIPDLTFTEDDRKPDASCSLDLMAEMIHSLCRLLGFEKYSVAGNSMGGYVALSMMRNFSGSVEGVVLVSTNPFEDTSLKRKNRLKEIKLLSIGKKRIIVNFFVKGLENEEMKDLYFEMTESLRPENLIALQKGMGERKDGSDLFLDPPCRLCYIYGENDDFLPLKEIDNLLFRAEKVAGKKIPGGNHFIVIKHKDEIAEYFVDCLRRNKN